MKRSVAYLLVLVMGFPLSMWSQTQAANPPEAQKHNWATHNRLMPRVRVLQELGGRARPSACLRSHFVKRTG